MVRGMIWVKKYSLPLDIFSGIYCEMFGKIKDFTESNAFVIYPKNLGINDDGLILYVFSDKKVFSVYYSKDHDYSIQTYKISNISCMNYNEKADGNNKLEIYLSNCSDLPPCMEFDSSKDAKGDTMRAELKNIIVHIFKELVKES